MTDKQLTPAQQEISDALFEIAADDRKFLSFDVMFKFPGVRTHAAFRIMAEREYAAEDLEYVTVTRATGFGGANKREVTAIMLTASQVRGLMLRYSSATCKEVCNYVKELEEELRSLDAQLGISARNARRLRKKSGLANNLLDNILSNVSGTKP